MKQSLVQTELKGPYLTTAAGSLPEIPMSGGNAEGTDWVYTKTTGALKAKAASTSSRRSFLSPS